MINLAPLVDAQREATGQSGAAELSAVYRERAQSHHDDWSTWLKWLIASLAVALVGGVILVALVHPNRDATTSEIVSALALELFVIGLLLYVVRLTSLQFRVHRHLEATAASKAAALSTFNRLVTGQTEPEIRAAIATALAQSVFAADESGFIDSSSDHITLIERVVGPATQRIASG